MAHWLRLRLKDRARACARTREREREREREKEGKRPGQRSVKGTHKQGTGSTQLTSFAPSAFELWYGAAGDPNPPLLTQAERGTRGFGSLVGTRGGERGGGADNSRRLFGEAFTIMLPRPDLPVWEGETQ